MIALKNLSSIQLLKPARIWGKRLIEESPSQTVYYQNFPLLSFTNLLNSFSRPKDPAAISATVSGLAGAIWGGTYSPG